MSAGQNFLDRTSEKNNYSHHIRHQSPVAQLNFAQHANSHVSRKQAEGEQKVWSWNQRQQILLDEGPDENWGQVLYSNIVGGVANG